MNFADMHALRWASGESDLTLVSKCWLGQACLAEHRLALGFKAHKRGGP